MFERTCSGVRSALTNLARLSSLHLPFDTPPLAMRISLDVGVRHGHVLRALDVEFQWLPREQMFWTAFWKRLLLVISPPFSGSLRNGVAQVAPARISAYRTALRRWSPFSGSQRQENAVPYSLVSPRGRPSFERGDIHRSHLAWIMHMMEDTMPRAYYCLVRECAPADRGDLRVLASVWFNGFIDIVNRSASSYRLVDRVEARFQDNGSYLEIFGLMWLEYASDEPVVTCSESDASD